MQQHRGVHEAHRHAQEGLWEHPQLRCLLVSPRFGVDEVGRGPLAGPLCVGAFLVPRARYRKLLLRLKGIKDSKQLTEAQRILWQAKFQRVRTEAGCRFSTVFVSERFIDREGLVADQRRRHQHRMSQAEGLPLAEFRGRFGVDLMAAYGSQVEELTALGLLERADGCLRLTARGRLLGNEVFMRFLPDT